MEYKCICGKEFDNALALGGHKGNCQQAKEERQKQLKILKLEEDNYNCICNCGRKFKTIKSLNSHARFCDQYQKKDKKQLSKSKYLNTETLIYKCECGYETKNSQALNGHFSHCRIHREYIGKDNSDEYWKNKYSTFGGIRGWVNLSQEQINDIYKKIRKTLHNKYKSGELTPTFIGKHHTEETKKHLSDIAVERKLNGTSPAHLGEHMSYLEKWFYDEILQKYNILDKFDVVREYCEKPYFIDFSFPNIKVGFELDGMFHLTDENHIRHDKKRDEYLTNNGWTLYRYNYEQIKYDTDKTIEDILNVIQKYTDNKLGENKLYSYQEYKKLVIPVGE